MATTTPIRDVVGQAVVFHLYRPGTLAVADDKPSWPMPKCRVIWAAALVEAVGGTSGATDITLENATDSVDLLASAISIAYNGTAYLGVVGTLVSSEASLFFDEGDKLSLNIDAIPGTASTGAHAFVMVELL